MKIEFTKEEPKKMFSSWHSCVVDTCAVFFRTADGMRHYVCSVMTGSELETPYTKADLASAERNLECYRRQLEKNGGTWLDRNATWPYQPDFVRGISPEEFVAFLRGKGWTFHPCTRIARYDDLVTFAGNLNEYACAFDFLIYDPALGEKVISLLPELKAADYRKKAA
jgi:hypothetical protein